RIETALLVPWTHRRKPAGVLWAIAHTPYDFDSEDARLLKNLADFVAAAWNIVSGRDLGQALAAKRSSELARTYRALEDSERELRAVNAELEWRIEKAQSDAIELDDARQSAEHLNRNLQKEIGERWRAEATLASELAAMRRLHELSAL